MYRGMGGSTGSIVKLQWMHTRHLFIKVTCELYFRIQSGMSAACRDRRRQNHEPFYSRYFQGRGWMFHGFEVTSVELSVPIPADETFQSGVGIEWNFTKAWTHFLR